jgi:hypothetical protein
MIKAARYGKADGFQIIELLFTKKSKLYSPYNQ